MKAKLQLLMDELQLRPGQFARMLEVNPAIISHILAERNKPGVELLQKILGRFPQVSPDWLLLDAGPMFRDGAAAVSADATPQPAGEAEQNLFASQLPATSGKPDTAQTQSTAPASGPVADRSADAAAWTTGRKAVARVVLLYADGTFDSFIPGSPAQ